MMGQLTEQTIATSAGPLTYLLHQPLACNRASKPALLLTFATTAQSVFQDAPYDIPFRRFAEEGHCIVSFDLPNHGSRVDQYGEGIEGMRNAFLAGVDPFSRFVADGRAVIDACLAQGIGDDCRIVVCGVSRGGYCALRLATAEPRIRGVAGLAPVTDWRHLSEFAQVREQPGITALALESWAVPLADRAVYLAIGNHDQRVGTDCCLRFAYRLFESEEDADSVHSMKQVHVVDSPGHSLATEWRLRGATFLLQVMNS